MPTPEKVRVLGELESHFSEAKSAVFADFRGLNVAQATALRRKLREAGVEYKVYKNTLLRIAAERAGVKGLEPYLQGPTAVAFSYGDPVAPAKVIVDFVKENKLKVLEVKCGVLKGETISQQQVAQLAALPSREVLLAKLAGTLQAPITGLVCVLSGPARKLVWTLDAIRQQKAEAGGAEQPAPAQ